MPLNKIFLALSDIAQILSVQPQYDRVNDKGNERGVKHFRKNHVCQEIAENQPVLHQKLENKTE